MIDIDLAAKIAKNYIKEHPSLKDTNLMIAEKQEHIYGDKNSAERIGKIRGAYHPKTDRAAFITSNIHDEADFKRTLNHELVGHFGINTFTEEAKLALLNRIVDSKNEPSLRFLWKRIDKEYNNSSELLQAEEVFASIAELVTNNKDKAQKAINSLQYAVIDKSRLLGMSDLENITKMIDTGLRNNSRKRKVIPESDNAQFDKDSVVTAKESTHKSIWHDTRSN